MRPKINRMTRGNGSFRRDRCWLPATFIGSGFTTVATLTREWETWQEPHVLANVATTL
jgi:hypothetical protein